MKRSLGTPYQCPTLPYPAPRSVRHPAPSRSRPLPYTVSRVLCPVSSVQPEKEIEKKEWKYLENAGKLCVVAGQILDVRGFSPFI